MSRPMQAMKLYLNPHKNKKDRATCQQTNKILARILYLAVIKSFVIEMAGWIGKARQLVVICLF